MTQLNDDPKPSRTFSSLPPFSDDPEQWVDAAGKRFAENVLSLLTREPRPGFERPQHNPTNRLLMAARRADADGHLADFCEGFLEQRNTEHPETDHAQRVLSRLANFTP